ncbi:MAG: long-chain fatty acid--CoA ligase, partial [Planctomycetota bacterium]
MSAERPSIAGLLERAVALDPVGEALRGDAEAYRWREVGGRVAQRAESWAQLGVRRGDRVAVLAHN